jgi:hypothetical protein
MRDPDDGLGETFPVDGRGRRWWNRSSPSWAATTRCTGSSSRRWRTTRSHASIRSRTGTAGWPTVATRHAIAGPSTLRVRAGGVGGPGAAGRVLRRLADLRPCGDVHRVHRVLPAGHPGGAAQDLPRSLTVSARTIRDRLALAREHCGTREFSRKAYRALQKTLSSATASRDLRDAVAVKTLRRRGDKATRGTDYRFAGR